MVFTAERLAFSGCTCPTGAVYFVKQAFSADYEKYVFPFRVPFLLHPWWERTRRNVKVLFNGMTRVVRKWKDAFRLQVQG